MVANTVVDIAIFSLTPVPFKLEESLDLPALLPVLIPLLLDQPLLPLLLDRMNSIEGRKIAILFEHAELVEQSLQHHPEVIICLAQNPSTPLAPLRALISQSENSHILLASTTFIPHTISSDLLQSSTWQASFAGKRKKLALVPIKNLLALPNSITEEKLWLEVEKWTEPHPFETSVKVTSQSTLCLEAPEDLLNVQIALLKRDTAHIGQEAIIHPTAHLIPPFFIGDHAEVEGNSEIGPWAILQPYTKIKHGTSICRSVVAKNTSIGEALEIDASYILGHYIYRKDLNAWGTVDPRLTRISPEKKHSRSLHSQRICLLNRALGLLLLTFTWPLTVWLRHRSPRQKQWVFIPHASCSGLDPQRLLPWYLTKDPIAKLFLNLPLLVQGYISLIGITPKNQSQWEVSSSYLRELYTGKHMGLILPQSLEIATDFPLQLLEIMEYHYILTKKPMSDIGSFLAFCRNSLKRTLKKLMPKSKRH